MKSKNKKIQILKKGMAILMSAMFLTTPMASAVTSLDDSYLQSSFWEQILYGEIGSTAKEIEEWFNLGKTTLYITNETQLRALAEYINDGNSCFEKQIILLNNVKIDTKNEWVPIGNIKSPFRGTFDGRGYTISGINFNRGDKLYSEITNIGLFGFVYEATIKNVNISNSKIDVPYDVSGDIVDLSDDIDSSTKGRYQNIGGIIGRSDYSKIENCKINNDVFVNGLINIGGIVGESNSSTIIGCLNHGRISGTTNVGGIVGYAAGEINGISTSGVNYNNESYKINKIISCINKGEIYGLLNNVGGIVGATVGDSLVQKCENSGSIQVSTSTVTVNINGTLSHYSPGNAGGIVGIVVGGRKGTDTQGFGTIDACINTSEDVTGKSNKAGIAGYLGGDYQGTAGRIIFTNNINYASNYLAGKIGNYGVAESGSYVYMANNLLQVGVYTDDPDIKQAMLESLYESEISMAYGDMRNYYETNNIEPVEKEEEEPIEPVEPEESEEEKELYKNSVTLFYYDYNEDVGAGKYKIIYPEGEHEIYMDNQETLNSLNLKLVAADGNGSSTTIGLGEVIELPDERTYSTQITIQFSTENAFIIDESGKWTIDNESKSWEKDKEYSINGATGATVKYEIKKQEYIEENEYAEPTTIRVNTYFKEKDKIIIIAKFEGISSLEDVSKELSLKKSDGEIIELEDATVDGLEITYKYTVQEEDVFEIVELIQGDTITVPINCISVDTIVPYLKSELYVENMLETERYTAGKDVLIKVTTSEKIDEMNSDIPQIQVEFTKSGIGKYNYLKKEGTVGFAKCIEGKLNIDGTTTWTYLYQIQEGDEGDLSFKYVGGIIRDLAGNQYELMDEELELKDWGAEDLKVTYKLYKNSVSEENRIIKKASLKKEDKLIVAIEYDKILYTMIGNVNEEEANEKFTDEYKAFMPSLYLNNKTELKGEISNCQVSEGKTLTTYVFDFNNFNIHDTITLSKLTLKNENNERFIALGSFKEGSIVYSAEDYETYLSNQNADAMGVEHQEYGFLEKDSTKVLEIEDIQVVINSEDGGYVYADTTAPTVQIIPAITNEEGKLEQVEITNADELTYVFKFSEYVTGFTIDDISVNGGIKGEFVEVVEGFDYTLKVQPTTLIKKEGTLQVIVEKGACLDQVAKENVRHEKTIIIDKIKPILESYNITQENDVIKAELNFNEAIKTGHILIKLYGLNGESVDKDLEAYRVEGEPNRIIATYKKDAAVGGKVKVSYEINVTDVANNPSGLITIEPEEEFILGQTIIRPNPEEDTYYTFEKNGDDINSFADPTYFKKGDVIVVKKYESNESLEFKKYSYTIDETFDRVHMRYITLIDAVEGETEGKIEFSNLGFIDISSANIYFDTVAPLVNLTIYVEEESENDIYTEGKELIITATTNEPIKNVDEIPEIRVSFSNSGLGKYNYQAEIGKGNAKYVETIADEKGTTWKYKYIVKNGDDGTAIIEYARLGRVIDNAGNETLLRLNPETNKGDIQLEDNEIVGKETKVSFEIYKNIEQLTEFSENTYFVEGDRLKIVAKFDKLLYSDYTEFKKIPVNESTAPKLSIDQKEFEIESVENNITSLETTITYVYEITEDDQETLLRQLNISGETLTAIWKELIEEETEDGIVQEEVLKSETLESPIVNNKNIKNCNLYIYNNLTIVIGKNIHVDTIRPRVSIKAQIEGKTEEGEQVYYEITSATNSNKIIYTVEFSEEVIEFSEDDIIVNGGAKVKTTEIEVGKIYELEVIPSVAEGNVGNVQLKIEDNAFVDKVRHGNVEAESIISVDKKAPILLGIEAYAQSNSKITLNQKVDTIKEYYTEGDKVTIVAIFDENVTTDANMLLQFADSGNAKGELSQESISGNRITYTYIVTKGDKGAISLRAFSGKAIDAAGNEIIVTKRALSGDTIIVDTISPKLEEIRVITPEEDGVYRAGIDIILEAIYDKDIYVLDNNEIKLLDTNIEVEEEDEEGNITISYTDNAPTLKLRFGNGIQREARVLGYGIKEDGAEDRTKLVYSYTITKAYTIEEEIDGEISDTFVPGDNGELNIVSYSNKEDIQMCDIAGNIGELDVNQTGSIIVADTVNPTVERITATVKEPIIANTGVYHKAGNEVEITVKFNEIIHRKFEDTIKVAFAEEETQDLNFKEAYAAEWEEDTDSITYTYVIEEGDNGFLYVQVPGEICVDTALNQNDIEEKYLVTDIYADTTNPYLATNTNGVSKFDINYVKNDEGIVTAVEVTAIFNEKVYSIVENKLVGLIDIPVLGLFVNGEYERFTHDSYRTEDGKTTIVYRKDISHIDTTNSISVNFIEGKVYDRAGNEMTIELVDGDISKPTFKDVKVLTPVGFYKAGEKIEIVARFNEETKLISILPKLTIKIGDNQEVLTGIYDPEDAENTSTIKVARYTYEVKETDNGALNIISLVGFVSDGVRTDDEISKIYIDVTDDETDDINTTRRELLDSEEAVYENNQEEYKNVIADTIKPYVTKVEVKANNKTIATYEKEETKETIINSSNTNLNEIEYVITFSELIQVLDESKIKLYNSEKVKIENNDYDEDGYYDQIRVKVATTTEGVQSLIILDEAVEDRAGNKFELERFNLITADFTKPIVRFISEYNGGVYIIPTSVGKVEIRPNIEVNEEISKLEYKWDDEEYTAIEGYVSISDISIPSKEFNTDGEHILYIRVADVTGNTTVASKLYKVSSSKINIIAENEDVEETAINKLKITNKNVIVKVQYQEGLTDNRKVAFKSEDYNEYKEMVPNSNGTYTVTENGTVYVEATDRVGNKVVAEKVITNIDKIAPTITLETNGANLVVGTGKTSAIIKTDVIAEDNMTEILDVKYVYLQEDINIQNMTEEQKTELDTKLTNNLEKEAKLEKVESTKEKVPYYLYVVAKDEAGNTTLVKSNKFVVLNTNKKIVVNEETSEETTIPAELSEEKLIAFEQKGKKVNIKYNNFAENEEYKDVIKEKSISLTISKDGTIDENNNFVEVNRPTFVTVKGYDACGNEVIAKYEVTRESIEKPEIDVYGNPEDWTNQDITLEVSYNKTLTSLTVNDTELLAKQRAKVATIIIKENGVYKVVAIDEYGNITDENVSVTKIDKQAPTISKVENAGKEITINATDKESGIAGYAISKTETEPIQWSENNVIKANEDGTYYVWVKDTAGNVAKAEKTIKVDTTAPVITFNYSSQIITVGDTLEVNVLTNEEAIISYSWDNQNWVNSDKLVKTLKVSKKVTAVGSYKLYVKATDKLGNESKVQNIDFKATEEVDVKEPEIIFNDISILQVNGVKYLKVDSTMTIQLLNDKMNKEALNGKSPEYKKLADNNKIKTGTEIALNGETKYVVVVVGDVDGDGKVTFTDIIKTNSLRINGQSTDLQLLAADVDNTNKVEFKDIININSIRINSAK